MYKRQVLNDSAMQLPERVLSHDMQQPSSLDLKEPHSSSALEESIEVVIAGYQKKNAVLSDQEKKVVAYHEIGHALVAALQSHSAPVQKITIIPRTSGALGYTMQVCLLYTSRCV